MRIFVFSDTHGDTSGMDLVLSKAKPDAIIHCGDGSEDAKAMHRKYPDIETYTVRGNCDDDYAVEQEKYIQKMGHTIYVAHGDKFDGVGGIIRPGLEREIVKYAKQHGADMVLHGHTHVAAFSYENGVYLMNPGRASLNKPFGYKPSFGYVRLYENAVTFKIFCLEVFERLSSAQVMESFV